jgi:hypothetical protein
MSAEDISNDLQNATTDPSEALKSVEGGQFFDMSPDSYKDYKNHLEPTKETLQGPMTASRTVASIVGESKEQAALMKPDIDHFSTFENIMRSFGEAKSFERKAQVAGDQELVRQATLQPKAMYEAAKTTFSGVQQRLSELNGKKRNGISLTDDERVELAGLREDAKNNFGQVDYGLTGPIEKIPSHLASAIADLPGLADRQKGIFTSIIGAETAIGASVGAAAGLAGGPLGELTVPAGALAGGLQGARIGLGHAWLAGSSVDAYEQSANAVYGELDQIDTKGLKQPLDDNSKRLLANGVGAVSAALNLGSSYYMAKQVPWIAKIMNPSYLKEVVSNPANSAMVNVLINLGKTVGSKQVAQSASGVGTSIAVNAGVAGVQDVVNTIAKEIGDASSGSQLKFIDGLSNAYDKISSNQEGKGTEVVSSMISGALVAAGLHAVNKPIMAGLGALDTKIDESITSFANKPKPKGPTPSKQISDGVVNVKGTRVEPSAPTEPPTNIVSDHSPQEQLANVLHMQDALEAGHKVIEQSNLKKLSPEQAAKVQARIMSDSGLDEGFVDVDSARTMSKDPQKGDVVRNLISPRGELALRLNAPARVDMTQAPGLIDSLPDLPEHLQLTPEGPNGIKAKDWLQKLEETKKQREDLTLRYNMGEKDPEQRAFDVKLTPENTDAEIANAIRSKETADAYLNRLDMNVVEEKSKPKTPETTQQLADIETMRKRVTAIKDSLPTHMDHQAILKRALATPIARNDVYNEPDYMDQTDLDHALKGIMGDGERAKFLENDRKGRELVAQAIKDGAKYERGKLLDIQHEIAKEIVREEGIAKVKADPNIKVVEKFRRSVPVSKSEVDATKALIKKNNDRLEKVRTEIDNITRDINYAKALTELDEKSPHFATKTKLEELRGEQKKIEKDLLDENEKLKEGTGRDITGIDFAASHHKKGFPQLAIDPRQLTDSQKNKYGSDVVLKKRKVFVNGGISPDVAARQVGLTSGDQLLEILATVPNEKEALDQYMSARQDEIDRMADKASDENIVMVEKSFNDRAANDLTVMKYMINQHLTRTGGALQKVALMVPRIEELKLQAVDVVKQMPIGELNINQFEVGGRVSRRKGFEAARKGDFLAAAEYTKAAALNSLISKEVRKAIAQNNKDIRFVRKFVSKENQAVLNLAGKEFVKAGDELLDVFSFDKNREHQSIQGSYAKWVEQMYQAGRGDFAISPELSDHRAHYKENTVLQAQTVANRLRVIDHSAKTEHEIQELNKAIDFEERANAIAAHIEKSKEFNIDRSLVANQGESTFVGEKTLKKIEGSVAYIRRMKHLIKLVDNNEYNGVLHNVIIPQLEGSGKFSSQGQNGKIVDLIKARETHEAIIKQFGKKEWINLYNDKVFVPEFQKISALGNGYVNRGMLFQKLLNMGNEDNIAALENFGVDRKTIMTVLERELKDPKYIIAAQNIWNSMKGGMFDRAADMVEKKTGVRPKPVSAKPFAFNGKLVDGGYYPIMHETSLTVEEIAKINDKAVKAAYGEERAFLEDNYHIEEMTDGRHLKARHGSTNMIDLSEGVTGRFFDRFYHDLNFREPTENAMKFLTHPRVREALSKTLGIDGYQTIVSTVVHNARPPSVLEEQTNSGKYVQAWGNQLLNSATVATLGYNPASVAVQLTSIVPMARKMGPMGMVHVMKILGAMSTHPHLIGEFIQTASEMVPQVMAQHGNINLTKSSPFNDLNPTKAFGRFMVPKQLAALSRMRDKVVQNSMWPMAVVDDWQKILFANAIYSQFMAGDVEGFNYDKIMSMTQEERDHAAKVHVSQMITTILTASSPLDRAPIQQSELMKNQSRFYDDGSNHLNNSINDMQELKWRTKEGYEDQKKGNYKKAGKNYAYAAYGATGLLMSWVIWRVMEDELRGKVSELTSDNRNPMYDTPLTGIGKEKSYKEALSETPTFIAQSAFNATFGHLPGISRDLMYAIDSTTEKNERYKKVTPFVVKPVNDAYELYKMANHFMDYVDGSKEMNEYNVRTLGFGVSYLVGGLPVRPFEWLYKLEQKTDAVQHVSDFSTRFIKRSSEFLKNQEKLDPKDREDADTLDTIRRLQKELHDKSAANDLGALDNSTSEKKD